MALQLQLKWLADDGARRALLAEQVEPPLVSVEMPLRANLTVLDNIALIPQYRRNLDYAAASTLAWEMLVQSGHENAAMKRDPQINHAERFVAKLLRAAIERPPIILIDRPALLLPDVHYPAFLAALFERLADHLNDCWILDYRWNAPLYPPSLAPHR